MVWSKGMNVTLTGGVVRGRRSGVAAGVIGVTGAVALAGVAMLVAHPATAADGTAAPSVQVTIPSPRPIFMQLNGQGPSLADDRVVWTATNGEGQSGTEADRIYEYNLESKHLSVPVRSHYGATGFIGGYVLADDSLAYVDTGFAPGSVSWRVSILDLHTNHTQTVATSAPNTTTTIPPQMAYDGTHLLLLQTADIGGTRHESSAVLYTPASHRQQVLQRVQDVLLGDPALGHNAALWTVIGFAPHPSSRLMYDDLAHGTLRAMPVGDVSQVNASGDLAVWKSGMNGTGGHIALYSLSQHRLISGDLAHSSTAIFPSINGQLVGWTYGDGSRIQIYSVGSSRVIYSAPSAAHRIYGPTSISSRGAAWVYTVLATGKGSPHGYVVVRQIQ